MNIKFSLLYLILFLVQVMSGIAADDFYSASLIAILSNPKKWDHSRVVTSGYLAHTNRGDLLFIGESDEKNFLMENSVAIASSKNIQGGAESLKALNGTYVRVEGEFRAYDEIEVKGVPVKGCLMIENIFPSNQIGGIQGAGEK